MQVKLLRFLAGARDEAGRLERDHPGGRAYRGGDPLGPRGDQGRPLREDLYSGQRRAGRLPCVHAERPADIPLLTEHVLRRFASELGKALWGLSPSAIRKLQGHRWPGNVRELENVVHRAIALAPGSIVELTTLDKLIVHSHTGPGASAEVASRSSARTPDETVRAEYVLRGSSRRWGRTRRRRPGSGCPGDSLIDAGTAWCHPGMPRSETQMSQSAQLTRHAYLNTFNSLYNSFVYQCERSRHSRPMDILWLPEP